MNRESFLKQLSATNGQVLGYLVGWSLVGGPAEQERVHDLVDSFDLATDFKLPRVGATAAFRRAVQASVKGSRGRKKAPFAAVKLDETADHITFAVVKTTNLTDDLTSRDANGDLVLAGDVDLESEFLVGFDKDKKVEPEKKLVIEGRGDGHLVADKIQAAYTEGCLVYTGNDLRGAFQAAFFRWGGFPMLEHGGMWFLPGERSDQVEAWRALLVALNHDPVIVPVFDTTAITADLSRRAENSLDGQIAALKDELEAFRGSDKKVRKSTLEKRVEALDDLVARGNLYSRVLGMEQVALQGEIEQLQQEFVSEISNLSG